MIIPIEIMRGGIKETVFVNQTRINYITPRVYQEIIGEKINEMGNPVTIYKDKWGVFINLIGGKEFIHRAGFSEAGQAKRWINKNFNTGLKKFM
jgi:hypothetical protein